MLGKTLLGLVAGVVALVCLQTAPAANATGTYAATAYQYCAPTGIDVRLDWKGQDLYGGKQYIDVSLDGTWSPGNFLSFGPLPAAMSSTLIPSLQPGATYYLRMSQEQANGSWVGNDAMYFNTVPACSYDSSYKQPFLPSPGSELLYPFQRAAIASIYAPGIVQVASYPISDPHPFGHCGGWWGCWWGAYVP
jgi:hypothetical protein